MRTSTTSLALLVCVARVSAQYYGGSIGSSNGGSNYGSGGTSTTSNPGSYYSPSTASAAQASLEQKRRMLIAHAVLAAVAFAVFFPVGGIVIRIGSFRHAWLVHGVVQLLAYIVYIAGAGIGIYLASTFNLLRHPHAIIGLLLIALLFLQPFLGTIHHYLFAKSPRRTVWSHVHIWLGRILITLGIINGGLGLQLAARGKVFAPGWGAVLLYSLIAGIMWLVYVGCTIFGEVKRSRAQGVDIVPSTKEEHTVSEAQPTSSASQAYSA